MKAVAALAVPALVAAPGAQAKFKISIHVAPRKPHVGQPVHVVIRAAQPQDAVCRIRLVAVAPGIGRYRALDAFIIGGTTTMGPTGPSFHRIRATPRLGFRARTRRTSPTRWAATFTFPRRGRWQLVVPNWCADGYAIPPPATHVVAVR